MSAKVEEAHEESLRSKTLFGRKVNGESKDSGDQASIQDEGGPTPP